MTVKIINKLADKILISIFVVMLFFSMNFTAPSPLPIGLNMPANAAVWLTIAILILLSFFKIIVTQKFRYSKLILVLAISCILLLVPAFYISESTSRDITLRVLQVIGFLLLFVSIFQFQFTQRRINLIFSLIVLSASFQIIYALAQVFHDPSTTHSSLMVFLGNHKQAIGGIGQINALSLYIITAIIISFYLLLQPSFEKKKVAFKFLLLFLMMGGGFIIFLNGSRVAILSLFISIPLILGVRWKVILKKKRWGIALLLGLILGSTLGYLSGGDRLKNKTTNPRTVVWGITVDAIKEKPIFGYGLGSFDTVFFDFNEQHVQEYPDDKGQIRSYFTHPHNELLYWWVESGVVSLLAFILFFAVYIWYLRKHRRKYSLQYVAMLLPISLSTQVSLPFYLSALLMVTFVFLLVLPVRNFSRNYSFNFNHWLQKGMSILSISLFVLYSLFIANTIKGGRAFVTYNKSGENDYQLITEELSNPYWNQLASVYTNIYLLRKELNSGNKEKAEYHLSELQKLTKMNDNPMYYQVLLVAYKLMGDDRYTSLLERMKKRHYYYFKNM